VEIATLDVRSRKPFQHGPSYFQRQAALCEQADDFDRAQNMALDEREFSRMRYLGGHVFNMAKRHGLPIRSRFARKSAYGPGIKSRSIPAGLQASPPRAGYRPSRITHGQLADAAGGGGEERLWSPPLALIPPARQN